MIYNIVLLSYNEFIYLNTTHRGRQSVRIDQMNEIKIKKLCLNVEC